MAVYERSKGRVLLGVALIAVLLGGLIVVAAARGSAADGDPGLTGASNGAGAGYYVSINSDEPGTAAAGGQRE